MRYLIIIILFVLSGYINAQTPKKISSYPAAASFDPEDLFIVADGGTTSKKMTGALIQAYAQLVGDNVRSALADTAIVLRSLLGGEGLFEKTLNRAELTNPNDSLGIGVTPTLGRLHVSGTGWFTGQVTTTALALISGGLVYMNGDEMMFYSNNTGLVTLTSLIGGATEFSETGTTNYTTTTTDNWHFGGTTATTYKLKVTGSGYFTDDVNIENYLRIINPTYPLLDVYVETVDAGILRMGSNGENSTSRQRLNLYSGLSSSVSWAGIGTADNDQYIWFVPDGTNAGYIRFDNGASDPGYFYDGTYWRNATDTLADRDYARTQGGGTLSAHLTDTLFFDYLAPAATGTRFIVLTYPDGGADSGVLNSVYRGLEDPLWNVHDQLADRKNREMKWYHIETINGKDSVFVSYGLPNGMDAIEALQYAIEQELRLIAEQDLMIKKLSEQVNKLESKPPPEFKSWIGLYVFLLLLLVVVIIKK